MAVLAVWLTVAGLVSTQAATGARTEGGEPLDTAVTARILAQQARADEILGLLKRGSDTLSDIRFDERTAQIGWLLDEHPVAGAADALRGWMRSHDEIRRRLAGGDYPGAVAIARDDGPQHSTAAVHSAGHRVTGRDHPTARSAARRDRAGLHCAEWAPGRCSGHRCAGGARGCCRYRATTKRVPLMRTIATVLALAVVLLAGCSTVQPLAEVSASLTTLPMPSGAEPWCRPRPARLSKAAMPPPVCARPPRLAPPWRRFSAAAELIVGVDQSTESVQLSRSRVRRIAGLQRRHRPRDRPGPGRRSRQSGVPPTVGAGAHPRGAEPDRRHPREGDDDHLSHVPS